MRLILLRSSPLLKIVRFPHPTLRHRSKPLRRVDQELKAVVAEMFDLMYEAKGIGLAANQVHLPFQLFVVNVTGERNIDEEMVFINPVVSAPRGQNTAEEGCLSLPGLFADVTRAAQVNVSAYDLKGNRVDRGVDGMLARVIQHELDHLQGTLFIDRLNPIDLRTLTPDLERMEREFAAERLAGKIGDEMQLRQEIADWETKYC